jgi:hypothetical protein
MKFTSGEIVQIIVAIIGLFGAIIQGVITIIFTQKSSKTNAIKRTYKDNKNKIHIGKYSHYKILSIIILLAVAIPGVKVYYTKYFIEPFVSITAPLDNQYVGNIIDIKGKYRNIKQEGQQIWVVVYSYNDSLFFPARSFANINPMNNEWTSFKTVIGNSSDMSGKYEILVLLLDMKSSPYIEIKKYIENTASHGLYKLPEGSISKDQISVFIKQNL